ncbi:MAG: prevent-host-death protein [Bacteroidetes bacterium]|nr:MAG: prevent-host-death protein [Bacteroidota bacterium]
MVIISSREFRDQQKKYFDLADQNEQIIIQRGKDKAYVIIPLNDADRLSVNNELIQTVQEAEAEYSKQQSLRIEDPDDIWGSIL